MSDFVKVCSVNDLIADSGVAALVKNRQVALFYIDGDVYAISNYDPIGEAEVLSRGMTGDIAGELVVASPLYKQHYSLISGQCLEQPDVSVPVYAAKIDNADVFVNV